MATFFSSPAFLSHPITRSNNHNHFSSSSSPSPPPPPQPPSQQPPQQPPLKTSSSQNQQQKSVVTSTNKSGARNVESTDWVATSLTRRFGFGAGLAWAGFLAIGVVSEQIKTRLEVSQQQANTRDVQEEEVNLPNGIRYYDLRVGGGASPRAGDLVVMNVKGKVQGSDEEFVDTFKSEKPLALVMGSRPYTKGICEGIETILKTMKAGGKRRVIIPPALAFGEDGADLGSGLQILPNATLEYIVEVDRVSIAPA